MVNPELASVRLDKRICPVELPPRVRFCALVVARFPFPVMYVALFPLLAEMEATGVPELTLIKANLELDVDVPPNATSSVVLYGERRLEFNCQ